jgi:fatty acid desaturase
LRTTIRGRLPADAFSPQRWRAALFPFLVTVAAASIWVAAQADTPWYGAVALSLVTANCFAMGGFLAHETLHGSVVRNKTVQKMLGFVGFLPFVVSPELWHVWHNQVHHGRTNQGDRDPDGFGTLERCARLPAARILVKFAPGSGTWYSALFLFYWFTLHGQVVLWVLSQSRAFYRMNKRTAHAQTALMALFWAGVAVVLGVKGFFLAVALPMALANFIVMSYIATNHFLRPQTEENDPVRNSMSVTTLPMIDLLHFNFSHHVEHHLFPAMSPHFAPRVRALLRELVGKEYVSPPHWKAIWFLYRTPRIYKDANTLIDPETGREVALEGVTRELREADEGKAVAA